MFFKKSPQMNAAEGSSRNLTKDRLLHLGFRNLHQPNLKDKDLARACEELQLIFRNH